MRFDRIGRNARRGNAHVALASLLAAAFLTIQSAGAATISGVDLTPD